MEVHQIVLWDGVRGDTVRNDYASAVLVILSNMDYGFVLRQTPLDQG